MMSGYETATLLAATINAVGGEVRLSRRCFQELGGELHITQDPVSGDVILKLDRGWVNVTFAVTDSHEAPMPLALPSP